MLFDTHTHYDDELFKEDRHETIMRAYNSGVRLIVNASQDISTSVESIALSQKYDFIYAAVGIHPHNSGMISTKAAGTLEGLASHRRVVAIGETGLDYYYENSPRDSQKTWLKIQLALARNLNLPVIIHDRDAHEDILKIIREEPVKDAGGVFHCFSGSVEMAKELIDHNFYISIGGPVTFKNAKRAVEVVKAVPDDRLLIETDCPYLTPEPYRGKRNESGYIRFVAEKIAEIKGVSFEEIARITTENAKRLFRIE